MRHFSHITSCKGTYLPYSGEITSILCFFYAFFQALIELEQVFVGLEKIRNAKNYGRYDR